MHSDDSIKALLNKGVVIPRPDTILIGNEVDPERISGEGVTLYPGVRVLGERTLICSGASLGLEAPVTLINTAVGKNTKLSGGYFKDAVFLGDNSFGSGAHVREGTILEEQANAAHTVGLKQTILFPFVTLGSLINFCDCLMAGGTSRKDHSEVGSSFIHFNFTPDQDKATPSIFGNVPDGVMLNQRPIFLGGQGGVVGPRRIGFGCVTAAGTIIRKDEERHNQLIIGASPRGGTIPFTKGNFSHARLVYNNNCRYLAGLIALLNWYRQIRLLFVADLFSEALHQSLICCLTAGIQERIKRLDDYCLKLTHAIQNSNRKSTVDSGLFMKYQAAAVESWSALKTFLENNCLEGRLEDCPRALVKTIKNAQNIIGSDYVAVIKDLDESSANLATAWLLGIERRVTEQALI